MTEIRLQFGATLYRKDCPNFPKKIYMVTKQTASKR